uniref:Stage III sporulation protein AF n=1 Tax=Ammonifex degensii TaxID=42838 RepID=A0A7C1JF00_9THEO
MERHTLLVRNVIVIVILAGFLDLLVPAGEMRRYVRMVVGLLIVVALLGAFTDFLHREALGLVALGTPEEITSEEANFRAVQERYAARALISYREGVARQVKALARLAGLDVARVEVVCVAGETGYPQLQAVKLYLRQVVPVVSQEPGVAEKTAVTIADLYNLPREKVVVAAQ